jgi:hypothetical protein
MNTKYEHEQQRRLAFQELYPSKNNQNRASGKEPSRISNKKQESAHGQNMEMNVIYE